MSGQDGPSNVASEVYAAVTGGYKNAAGKQYSSIFGGKGLTTLAEYEAIP
jgi:hypothetical protein